MPTSAGHLGRTRLAMVALALGVTCSCGKTGKDGSGMEGMRFLALGDSYTIGEAVDPAERWPVQLAALLRAEGVRIGDPKIIATTGWTTDELAAGMDVTPPSGEHDLVSLLIGVNDQYRGRTVDDYRLRFVTLLRRAIGHARGDASRVIVLSIPDWSVTPFAEGRDRTAIASAIDAFNAAAEEETRRAGARWVDVTNVSRTDARTFLAPDGLHPSGAQYALWARAALSMASVALRPAAG